MYMTECGSVRQVFKSRAANDTVYEKEMDPKNSYPVLFSRFYRII